jgi:hypothetical protein
MASPSDGVSAVIDLEDAPLGLDCDFPEKVWVYGAARSDNKWTFVLQAERNELFVMASFSEEEITAATDGKLRPHLSPLAIESERLAGIVAKGRNDAGKYSARFRVMGVLLCDRDRKEIARRYVR